MTFKQQIQQLAKEQYHIELGEFIYFSSASELIAWLASSMNPSELRSVIYSLGNLDLDNLRVSGYETPAEAHLFGNNKVFILRGENEKYYIYSDDFVNPAYDYIFYRQVEEI